MYGVQHYASVRHAHYNDNISQRKIAESHQLNRRTVQKMIRNPEPILRKRRIDESSLKLSQHKDWIDEILESDKKVHKKQRHTALRIFKRLQEERSFNGGYTIVRQYIAEKRLRCREMYIPLIHEPGYAQFDFGEADGTIGGKKIRFHYAVMQLPYSGACFVKAYAAENTESFCDAHSSAFQYFGGVPKRILYDNTKIAVNKILGYGNREISDGFLRLKSHYLFTEVFANPTSGNEKGAVENGVGYVRRNFMVPEPVFDDFDAFNAHLEASVKKAMKNTQAGYNETTEKRFESESFLPLPNTVYESFSLKTGVINSEGLVRFKGNEYSVPLNLGVRKILIKGFAEKIQIIDKEKVISEHKRLYGKNETSFEPVHYLSLLERKSRAFYQAAPLKDWILPEVFKRVHARLLAKDPLRGTRLYIGILRLLENFDVRKVEEALKQSINLDCVNVEAIRHLLNRILEGKPPSLKMLNHPHIPTIEVQQTNISAYTQMIGGQL